MKDEIKNITKNTKGITLIALVITIIVLLILAGVSIAMLTGENGIMNNAKEAKTQTEYKSAEEKVNLAIIKTMADDGQMTVEELRREIERQGGTVTGTAFPVQVQMDGYTFTVDAEGNINNNGSSGENKPPVNQGTLGTVTGNETTNTVVQDNLGNKVVVPAGFKVQNPDKTVPDGIVIEDVSHVATKGSEFVWIPVGTVNRAGGDPVTIELKRYVFTSNGTIDESLTKTEPGDQLKTSASSSYYYTEGLKDSTTSNTHAKDIEAFRTSAVKNKGYYIGRYEARDKDTTTARTSSTSDTNQLVCTPGNYVYNYVTQPQAAERSQKMYAENSNFTSDLVNSYAWDTAITFLQTFDNRAEEAKTKPYSQQNSLNSSFAEKGTNQLETKDIICNIYDMASNTYEWSTETYSGTNNPCVERGGYYRSSSIYASYRNTYGTTSGNDGNAFRPLLYL